MATRQISTIGAGENRTRDSCLLGKWALCSAGGSPPPRNALNYVGIPSAVRSGRPHARVARRRRRGRRRCANGRQFVLRDQGHGQSVCRPPGQARVSTVGTRNIGRHPLGDARRLRGRPTIRRAVRPRGSRAGALPGQREANPAPFVVQFPSVVDLESTYVGSLPDQNIPQCLIYSPFIGPKAGGPKLLTISDQPASGLPDIAVGIMPIKAPLPQPALPTNCKAPYRDPYVGYQASADGPMMLLVKAQVTVTALLKSDGKVLGFTVAGAPDRSSLKDRAIAATVGSKFFPEVYRCQAVAGQYVFQVNFEANEARLSAPMGNSPMDVTQGRARDDVSHSSLTNQSSRPDRSPEGGSDCASQNDAAHCASPNDAPTGTH
jgi:hypothetical protein